MSKLETERTDNKETIKAGTILARQGETHDRIFILHSGFCEALYVPPRFDDPGSPEAIKNSLRIGFTQGPVIVGAASLFNSKNVFQFSLRAVSDCVISSQPMVHADLDALIDNDPSLFSKLLKAIAKHIEHGIILHENYRQLWMMTRTIADGLALGTGIPASNGGGVVERSATKLRDYASSLKRQIDEKESGLPDWQTSAFSPRTQEFFLPNNEVEPPLAEIVDIPNIDFLMELVKHDDDTLVGKIIENRKLGLHLYNSLSLSVGEVLSSNAAYAVKTRALMDQLYGAQGWCVQARALDGAASKIAQVYFYEQARCSLSLRKPTAKLLGIDPPKFYPAFYQLKDFRSLPVSDEDKSRQRPEDITRYTGLLGKILDFAGMADDFREKFVPSIEAFIDNPNPDVFIDELGQMYWTLYERCFLRAVASDLKAFVPGIMLHFGVLDERLLTSEQLAGIDVCYREMLYRDDPIPVMTLPYFLEKIYSGEVDPSMEEMGDSFSTVLRSQAKMTDRDKEQKGVFKDEPDDRVRYELRRISGSLQSLIYGSRTKSVPFLIESNLEGDVGRLFTDPEGVENLVQKYRDRDFSMFFREILIKNDLGTDFIQLEVPPNFVIYPGSGNRMIVWQEMDGTKKRTAGRIILPAFFTGNFEDSLISQLAEFRWLLQKSIAGSNWTDPVDGGLTGAYYDYITYFKKNPAISSEAKERLKIFVSRTKSDKERFAIDYRTWVDNEFSGMLKLTPAARALFFRFCPFPKEKREELSVRPTYESLNTKYENLNEKELLKIRSRLKKYKAANTIVPTELTAFLKYLER